MNSTRAISFVCVVLALLLVQSGCATTGRQAARDPVLIRVNNDYALSSPLTVSIISESGFQSQVGLVAPSNIETLRFGGAIGAGRYRLIAETTRGGSIVSRPFPLFEGATVVWDVQPNTIAVTESAAGT